MNIENINIKEMKLEELKILQSVIADEIKARNSSALVLYTHGCKNSANYHLNKYKHWAKLVKSVDTTKTNGYAFAGEFLAVTAEHKVPIGSVIVEVCGKDIDGYVMESTGKHHVASGKINSMSSFIDVIAALF